MSEPLQSWIVKILPSEDSEISEGTGFWAADDGTDGYVLTCTHVVNCCTQVKEKNRCYLWIISGGQKACAEIFEQEGDITLLRVPRLKGKVAPLGVEWQAGDPIRSLGYQYEGVIQRVGYFPIEATISGLSELDNTERITLKNAIHITNGASGSPALNCNTGKVIGIISDEWKRNSDKIKWESEEIAFALPLSTVINKWDVLKKEVEKPLKKAVCKFLEEIEDRCKSIQLFLNQKNVPLEDLYVSPEVMIKLSAKPEDETSQPPVSEGKNIPPEEWRKTQTRQRLAWDEVKQRYRRLMVLADTGMGKSLLLQREAMLIARSEREKLERGETNVAKVQFPIWLKFSELAKKEEEWDKTIPELVKHGYPDVEPEIETFVKDALKSKERCVLLLDALDEVRDSVRERLQRFARIFPCRIIATSRITGYAGVGVEDMQTVEITLFRQPQIEAYLHNRFNSLLSGWEVVFENKSLFHLAQNPLMLSLLCNQYQSNQDWTLPTQRAQVYKKAIWGMLQDWPKESQRLTSLPKLNKPTRIHERIRLLEHLAYHFSEAGQSDFTLGELKTAINVYKEKYKEKIELDLSTSELIDHLSEEDGILRELDPAEHRYQFLHQTFQEYLTASYLHRQEQEGTEFAKKHWLDVKWHETLLLFVGQMEKEEAANFLKTRVKEHDDIFWTGLLFAGRCLAESKIEDGQRVVKTICDKLYHLWREYSVLKTFVSAYWWEVRHRKDSEYVALFEVQIITLGQKYPYMLQRLCAGLHDKHPKVRRNVLYALMEIGNPQALPAIIDALCDKNDDVKGDAALALGSFSALENFRDPQSVSALVAVLCHGDGWWRIALEVATALSKIGNQDAANGLLKAFHAKNKEWSEYAAKALASLRADCESKYRPEWLINIQVMPGLINALQDPEWNVRRLAAMALSGSKNPKAISALVSHVNDPHEEVRQAAVEALSWSKDPQAIVALVCAFHDPHEEVRKAAMKAIEKIDDPQVVLAFIEALHNPNSDVRRWAVYALRMCFRPLSRGYCRDEDEPAPAYWVGEDLAAQVLAEFHVLSELQAILYDQEDAVRRAAAGALAQIGVPQIIPADPITSEEVIEHRDPNIDPEGIGYSRICALGWKAQSGHDAQAIAELLTALHDQNQELSRWAAGELWWIDDSEVITVLMNALHDECSWVRANAVYALSHHLDPRVIATLTELLHDEDESVKSAVLNALRDSSSSILVDIGSSQVVSALMTILSDQNPTNRSNAVKILGEVGSTETVRAVINALQDPDKSVREDAIETLGKIGNSEAVPAMTDALQDTDEGVRKYAIEALGRIGNSEAISGLIKTFQNQDKDLRKYIIETLRKIGNREAAQALLEIVRNYQDDLQEAFEALIHLEDLKVIPLSVEDLDNQNMTLRLLAVQVLGERRDHQAVVALINVLRNREWEIKCQELESQGISDGIEAETSRDNQSYEWRIRERTAEALGKIGDPIAVPALLEVLPEELMKWESITALGRIGTPEALFGLLQYGYISGEVGTLMKNPDLQYECVSLLVKMLLRDENENKYASKEEVVNALGEMYDALSSTEKPRDFEDQTIDALVSAIHDHNEKISTEAKNILERMEQPAKVLKALLEHPEIDIYDDLPYKLARKLAIRASDVQPKPDCLPVYSRQLAHKPRKFRKPPHRRFWRKLKDRLTQSGGFLDRSFYYLSDLLQRGDNLLAKFKVMRQRQES